MPQFPELQTPPTVDMENSKQGGEKSLEEEKCLSDTLVPAESESWQALSLDIRFTVHSDPDQHSTGQLLQRSGALVQKIAKLILV